LLDFNPFGPVTDSLLYSWEELSAEGPIRPEEVGIHLFIATNMMVYHFLKSTFGLVVNHLTADPWTPKLTSCSPSVTKWRKVLPWKICIELWWIGVLHYAH